MNWIMVWYFSLNYKKKKKKEYKSQILGGYSIMKTFSLLSKIFCSTLMNFSRNYSVVNTSLGQNGSKENRGDKMFCFGSEKA